MKFSGTGVLIWSKVGGPGFGAGRDVAVSPDGTAVFVSGNMLADDPDFFGGFAFVAEFTSGGKAKKANSWGSSPEFSASARRSVFRYCSARLEIDGSPQRPHRATVPRKEPADDASAVVIVIVIVAEVEEGVAVVAVDAEVSSRQDLQADAGVPAELGRADFQICGAVERFRCTAIPPRPTQHEDRNLTARPQEERRLYRSLREFPVEGLRRLGMPVQRHLEAKGSADEADWPPK